MPANCPSANKPLGFRVGDSLKLKVSEGGELIGVYSTYSMVGIQGMLESKEGAECVPSFACFVHVCAHVRPSLLLVLGRSKDKKSHSTNLPNFPVLPCLCVVLQSKTREKPGLVPFAFALSISSGLC